MDVRIARQVMFSLTSIERLVLYGCQRNAVILYTEQLILIDRTLYVERLVNCKERRSNNTSRMITPQFIEFYFFVLNCHYV